MTCEKCGMELIRGSVVCRGCHHSNGPRGGSGRLSLGVEQPGGVRLTRRGDYEGNLIRFPAVVADGQAEVREDAGTEGSGERGESDWRERVRERVREARERKGLASEEPEAKAALDRNPIVESALNRIRSGMRPEGTRSVTARVRRGGAASAALAESIGLPEEVPSVAESGGMPVATGEVGRRVEDAPRITANLTEQVEMAGMAATLIRESEERSAGVVRESRPVIEVEPKRAEPLPAAPVEEKKSSPAYRTQIIGLQSPSGVAESRIGRMASLWIRTLAGGCDFEVVAVAFLPIFAAYASMNTIAGWETLLLMGMLLAVLSFVYQAVTLGAGGRTFGMALLNVRLISLSGEEEQVTRRQKMMRAWGATVAFVCPPLNLLVRLLNSRGLTLPDLISNTLPVER